MNGREDEISWRWLDVRLISRPIIGKMARKSCTVKDKSIRTFVAYIYKISHTFLIIRNTSKKYSNSFAHLYYDIKLRVHRFWNFISVITMFKYRDYVGKVWNKTENYKHLWVTIIWFYDSGTINIYKNRNAFIYMDDICNEPSDIQ